MKYHAPYVRHLGHSTPGRLRCRPCPEEKNLCKERVSLSYARGPVDSAVVTRGALMSQSYWTVLSLPSSPCKQHLPSKQITLQTEVLGRTSISILLTILRHLDDICMKYRGWHSGELPPSTLGTTGKPPPENLRGKMIFKASPGN